MALQVTSGENAFQKGREATGRFFDGIMIPSERETAFQAFEKHMVAQWGENWKSEIPPLLAEKYARVRGISEGKNTTWRLKQGGSSRVECFSPRGRKIPLSGELRTEIEKELKARGKDTQLSLREPDINTAFLPPGAAELRIHRRSKSEPVLERSVATNESEPTSPLPIEEPAIIAESTDATPPSSPWATEASAPLELQQSSKERCNSMFWAALLAGIAISSYFFEWNYLKEA